MKNALILHGTASSSKSNWFPWLKGKLEEKGWKVWVPDLPEAVTPNIKRYNEFLLSQPWDFNDESVIIGHSSGSVEILGLLQALPEGTQIKEAVLVGSFVSNLGRPDLAGLFEEEFNYEKIKTRAKKFTLIHSDDDPFCPLAGARALSEVLGGELIVQEGQKHFSIGTAGEQYKEFPFILDLLDKN